MDNYFIGTAKVTSKGILFRGEYYSNSQAIRENWFEIAKWLGNWTVAVIFNSEEMKKIYLVNEKNNNLIECRSIGLKSEFAEYKEKLEKYVQTIQKLQRDRNSGKKKHINLSRRQRIKKSFERRNDVQI